MKRTGIAVVAVAASFAAGCGSDAAGTRTARPAPDPVPAPSPASRRPRTVQGEHAQAVAAWRTALAGARACECVTGERERSACYGDLDRDSGRALTLIYDDAIGAAATAACRHALRRARAAATAAGADVAALGGSGAQPAVTRDELAGRRRDGERALARYVATWADALAACAT